MSRRRTGFRESRLHWVMDMLTLGFNFLGLSVKCKEEWSWIHMLMPLIAACDYWVQLSVSFTVFTVLYHVGYLGKAMQFLFQKKKKK
jgi:hypothetical protein